MSYIGANKVGKMYLGSTAIGKAYLGDELVYSSAPSLPITETPSITYVENADNVVITATGYGTVVLMIDGIAVTNPYTISKTSSPQSVTATATAQENGKEISTTATLVISIPAAEWPHIGTWQDGYKLGTNGNSIVEDSGWILTPYYNVTPGHKITFWNGSLNSMALDEMPLEFTSVSQRNDYWNMSMRPRTITLMNSTKKSYYVIMAILKSQINYAYIKDATTGEYLFKGANIS